MATVTLHDKTKLLLGLISGEKAQTGPFFVTVYITRRCNLRCLNCRFHSSHIPSPGGQSVNDLSLELFKRLCHELKSLRAREMWLTGEGEPFLHPHLFDFITLAKQAGLHVGLFTNDTLLDEDRIRSLIDSRLDVLIVSLWANSPEAYEQNYPGSDPGNFFRVREGMKLLASLKGKLKSDTPSEIMHQPINRHNFQSLGEAANLALSTGCNNISFSPLKNPGGRLASDALSSEEKMGLPHFDPDEKEVEDIFPQRLHRPDPKTV